MNPGVDRKVDRTEAHTDVDQSTTAGQALPVLIFDGDCGFCTKSARWGQRRFHLDNVEPWQSVDVAALGLTEQECDAAVQWVGRDGSIQSGHRAIAGALKSSGRWARPVGAVLEWPIVSPIAALVYRTVAKNRHRLPGATEACQL